jgi:hypothetical protein
MEPTGWRAMQRQMEQCALRGASFVAMVKAADLRDGDDAAFAGR